MIIIVDSREQLPFTFSGYDCEIQVKGLPTGDYSIDGLEDRVSVERKSLDDLVGCLCNERERFKREMDRLKNYHRAAVVVEAPFEDLQHGRYRSRMNPHSACASVLSFQVFFNVPFLFAGSRSSAEYVVFTLLRRYNAYFGLVKNQETT